MDPFLEEFLSDPAADLAALHDVSRIKAILEQAAREGRAVSYSELLLNLGFRFTRPKMRAVCKTLDEVDQQSMIEGAPALAVLVVREGDGLPGQGWWTGRSAYRGQWTGRKPRPISGDCRRKFLLTGKCAKPIALALRCRCAIHSAWRSLRAK